MLYSTRLNAKEKAKKKPPKKGEPLTPREIDVLKMICKEVMPTKASKLLGISDKTFFNHRARILVKARAKTNVGLYRYALKKKIVKL